ncbi:hypothetical protein [Isoptericola sp. NPDC019571]|uniref:hypothetical protein n=1 Tax=Isoptericola sp. NPDC019571 TaxID=3364008 RepID=UPI00379A1917
MPKAPTIKTSATAPRSGAGHVTTAESRERLRAFHPRRVAGLGSDWSDRLSLPLAFTRSVRAMDFVCTAPGRVETIEGIPVLILSSDWLLGDVISGPVTDEQRRRFADLVHQAMASEHAGQSDDEVAEAEGWLDSLEVDHHDPSIEPPLVEDPYELRRVGLAQRAIEDAERELRDAVASARREGRSWAEVGRTLGVTRQAAQARFGRAS